MENGAAKFTARYIHGCQALELAAVWIEGHERVQCLIVETPSNDVDESIMLDDLHAKARQGHVGEECPLILCRIVSFNGST